MVACAGLGGLGCGGVDMARIWGPSGWVQGCSHFELALRSFGVVFLFVFCGFGARVSPGWG